MTEFNFEKQAQDYYARAPVIILGSGASMAFDLPSMGELADHIKSNTDTTQIPGDQSGNWKEFCSLLDTGVDLEASLHQVNFSQEMTRLIVFSAWELINVRDNNAYKSSLVDKYALPLGKLLTHMFRSSLATVDVITTNYDCLVEYACDQEELHYYNGFSYGYSKRLIDLDHVRCPRTVNIWKVHGSVDWFYLDGGETISTSKSQYMPKEYQPQIVTPGIEKYHKTHLEPFRTIISTTK